MHCQDGLARFDNLFPVPWPSKTWCFEADRRCSFLSTKVVAVEGVNMYSGVLIPSNIYEVGDTTYHKESVVRGVVCVCVAHP